MTLIIMLILAGISLSGLIGGKGLFQRTEKASNRYNEAKARETLETVLLTDGQYDKNINPEYNENEYLNELIKKEIPGSKVIEDVAIVDGYGYELDRSVPKIGRYVGKENDLVWPTVDATVKLADDKKDATITITASEEKQGINKIEIWLLGEKIKEYTYDPSKPEATENYIATQNGEYTIKAYGDLMASKKVEVNGIVASVKFDPNGDETWKKSHSTTVTIQETADKVISAKYVWANSVTTPDDSKFPEDQTFKSGDTITKNDDTGTYYLWTRLQTQSGEILKWRSEGFNFDNEAPTVELMSTPVSETSFTLTATASDDKSGIAKYEFYVNEKLEKQIIVDEIKKADVQELTVNNAQKGKSSCYVIVTDKLGNSTRKDTIATTLNKAPIIIEVSLESKTTNSITITSTATDEDNDKLIYKLYVGTSSNNLSLVNTSEEMDQGIQVILLKSGLSQYTKYYYKIEVTDGFNVTTSTIYSTTTMCPGTGLHCSGGSSCSTCGGSGRRTCPHQGLSQQSTGQSNRDCPYCGQYAKINTWTYKCSQCGLNRKKYQCPKCNKSWNEDSGGGTLTCSTCGGSGKRKCSHGYTSSHSYCSHGKTSPHD